MNYLSQYNIPFHGLNAEKHIYDFVVESEFFDFFENSQIKSGEIKVTVSLFKRITSLSLSISLTGVVQVTCDRCLELYAQRIEFKDDLIVEFSDKTDFDTNKDFVFLDRSESEINISQFIYEFAHFALPFKRMHPVDSDGNSTCNNEMLDILDKHAVEVNEEIVDSRWEKLLEIKHNYK